MTFTTVFDASQQSSVMDWLFPAALVVGAVFAFASSRLRTRLPFGLGYIFPLLVLIAAAIFSVSPFWQHRLIANDLTSKHYTLVEGPVTDYQRPTYGAQGYRSGRFVVQGQQFSMPNYIIKRGFDNQGDAIEVGHYVRITHDGGMILRVERGG